MGESARILKARAAAASEKEKLVLVEGGQLFALRTKKVVEAGDFAGTTIIRTMTLGRTQRHLVYQARPEKNMPAITSEPAPPTRIDAVINTVLGVTHGAMSKDRLEQARGAVTEEFDRYEVQKHELRFDRQVLDAILSATSRYEDADLLRGVEAFGEAVQDVHGSMYDPTIIDPARDFARWLIVVEQS